MSTLDTFVKEGLDKADEHWITAEEMQAICPTCAESMAKRGMKKVAVAAVVDAMLADALLVDAKAPGNIKGLVEKFKSKEHPFAACKEWAGKQKGIADSDKMCGKIKHLIED